MTINLDTEIIATSHDPVTRMHSYTMERGGRRWTVSVHDDEFSRCGSNKQARRNLLGNRLQEVMRGKADGE